MNLKLEDVLAAKARIKPYLHKTPLRYSQQLSERLGCELYVKCENLQKTGSFKARGVTNLLLCDTSGHDTVTTYSSGNHGQALAWGAKQLGRKAVVFMPEDASPAKVSAVKGYGGDVHFAGLSSADRYQACMTWMEDHQALEVPPFDHEHIIAGQGTTMIEILEDLPQPDAVLIPAGGGGLLSGNALAAANLRSNLEIFACEPESAADVKMSLDSGERTAIEYPDTLADGLRNLCLGELNWEIVRKHVTAGLVCSEKAIKRAMAAYAQFMKLYVEPSGAVTLATLMEQPQRFAGKTVVLILSGGNVAPWDYARMVNDEHLGTFE